MTASALTLGTIGICLTFLADETAAYVSNDPNASLKILLQVLGSLYFGFAMLNWMAKGSAIGGIYNRPISIANFSHYLVGGLAILKSLVKQPDLPSIIWILGGVYCLFGLLFGIVFNQSPVGKASSHIPS